MMNFPNLIFRPSHEILVRDYLFPKIHGVQFSYSTYCFVRNLSSISVLNSDIGSILQVYYVFDYCNGLYFFLPRNTNLKVLG